MNLQSLFGNVTLGKDASGNLKQSLRGLAVRASADGKFIARDGDQYVDVTELTIEGGENYVYQSDDFMLMLMLAGNDKSDTLQTLLLLQALQGSRGLLTDIFSTAAGSKRPRARRPPNSADAAEPSEE